MRLSRLVLCAIFAIAMLTTNADAKKKRNYLQKARQKQALKAATVFDPNDLPKPTRFLFRHFLADYLGRVDNDTIRLRIWISGEDAYAEVTADIYGVVANPGPEAGAFVDQWFADHNNPDLVHPYFVSIDPRPKPAGTVYQTAVVPYVIPPFTLANLSHCLGTEMVAAGHATATKPPYDGWAEELYGQ